jgi:RNA polymerase sigma-70 factor (ECF subfamily)
LTPDDERLLLERARRLDQDALTAIFDAYYEAIFRYVYVRVGHVQASEDLAAQVFQRLLSQLRQGRGPEDYLKAWLFRVAENLIVDDARRGVHRAYVPLDQETADFAAPLEEGDPLALRQLRAALAELPPLQQRAITLRYLLELSNDEIAQVLNCTVGAAKAHVHRGLQALRGKLSEKHYESE